MSTRALAAFGGALLFFAYANPTAASAATDLSLWSASTEAEGVTLAVAFTYTCEPGAGDIGFWVTVTQRHGDETVVGSAAGGFYASQRPLCTGDPELEVMHLPAEGGFFKSGEALFEIYMYTCCETNSLVTASRITQEAPPQPSDPPQETGDLYLRAADGGELLAKGIAVRIPVVYRCTQPVVAAQIYATLAQKVGQHKVTDDADPIQTFDGALVCDGAERASSLLFRAPDEGAFEANRAFVSVGLERYDGAITMSAHDYRSVDLAKSSL